MIALCIPALLIILLGRGIIAHYTSDREKREIRFRFLRTATFAALYTFYITAFIGSAIVSEYKNIDVGTGDAWYAPISSQCSITFIDDPSQGGTIECDGNQVISNVVKLRQDGALLYTQTDKDAYLVVNTTDFKISHVANEDIIGINEIPFEDAYAFYRRSRNKAGGPWLIVVGILSFAASITAIYIVRINL